MRKNRKLLSFSRKVPFQQLKACCPNVCRMHFLYFCISGIRVLACLEQLLSCDLGGGSLEVWRGPEFLQLKTYDQQHANICHGPGKCGDTPGVRYIFLLEELEKVGGSIFAWLPFTTHGTLQSRIMKTVCVFLFTRATETRVFE